MVYHKIARKYPIDGSRTQVKRITMDTSIEAAMNVHRKDGTIMKFKEYHSGQYYFDAGDRNTTSKNE